MSLDDDNPFQTPGGASAPEATQPSGVAEEEDVASFSVGDSRRAAAVDATRPASEGQARRRSAKSSPAGPGAPGTLASKVLALRILEDDVAALLGEVECALQALESDRTLEDAGFRSADDFRERIAPQLGLLHAMREPRRRAPQQTGKVKKRSAGRPKPHDMRTRRTHALGAIELAMARFRELGATMRGKVAEAHDLLAGIDHERTYAECGYTSFEEFMELAIGPSPILAKCLTVLGDFPAPPPPEPEVAPPVAEAAASSEEQLPSLADPPGPAVSDDRPPALFELPETPPSEEPSVDAAPPSDEPVIPGHPTRRQRSVLIVSVVMGVASALIGTAAGVRATSAAQAEPAAEPPAVVAASSKPPAASPPPAAAPPDAKHGPTAQVVPASAAAARRGHDDHTVPSP